MSTDIRISLHETSAYIRLIAEAIPKLEDLNLQLLQAKTTKERIEVHNKRADVINEMLKCVEKIRVEPDFKFESLAASNFYGSITEALRENVSSWVQGFLSGQDTFTLQIDGGIPVFPYLPRPSNEES